MYRIESGQLLKNKTPENIAFDPGSELRRTEGDVLIFFTKRKYIAVHRTV